MGLQFDTVVEVQTTGSDTAAGGGFTPSKKGATGVDMTLGAATAFTSNLSATGSTTLTCSSPLFLNTMLGNIIQITGQGFYCIQTFSSTTAVVVDRAHGTFSATSGFVGGALASPGLASSIQNLTQVTVFIKSGTYSITSATAGVSGGTLTGSSNDLILIGYSTNRVFGNTDTAPVLQLNVTSAQISGPTNLTFMYNLVLDGNNQTASRAGGGVMLNCVIKNCNTASTFISMTGCLVTGNSAMMTGTTVTYSEAYGNSATPWSANAFIDSLSYSNTGASTDGFSSAGAMASVSVGCAAVSNGRDGWHNTGNGNNILLCQNCIAESNGGLGFNVNGFFVRCSTFSNTGGAYLAQAISFFSGCVVTSASAFTGAPDFSLNNLASRGAALRAAAAAAAGGLFPRGLTTTYRDIGPAQHADPVKLLTVAGMTGGME